MGFLLTPHDMLMFAGLLVTGLAFCLMFRRPA
jgi:hypothetical protein